MPRSPHDDSTTAADTTAADLAAPPGAAHGPPADDPEESLRAATRALAEATASLTSLVRKQASGVVPDALEALSAGLREAAQGLTDASVTVERKAGVRRAAQRRRAKADRTRAGLLAAAAKVFAEKGYEGASVGDLAAAAGYTKGAVYAHFGSKQDVFLALLREQACAEEDPRAEALAADPAERAERVAAWLAAAGGADGFPLALEVIGFGLRHPEARGEVAESAADTLRRYADLMASLRRAGPTDAGPTDEDWARALTVVALTNIAPVLHALTQSPHTAPDAVARVIDRILP